MIDYKLRYELLKKYTFFKQQTDILAAELNKMEEEEKRELDAKNQPVPNKEN